MSYKEIINRFSQEIWDDLSLIPEVSPDYFSKNCLFNDICQFKNINAWAQSLPEVFPSGLKTHKSNSLQDGHTVVLCWEDIGRHETTIFGAPPTGKKVFLSGVSIGTFENSKIITWDCCWDYNEFLAQIFPRYEPLPILLDPQMQIQEIRTIITSWKHLTSKEIFHLSFWVNGRSCKDIAMFLKYTVSVRTVEAHIQNASRKLRCSSRGDLIAYLHAEGKMHIFRRLYDLYLGYLPSPVDILAKRTPY